MKKKDIFVIIFGIGFGLLEAIVVIYLRELFYPSGFIFPLQSFMPIKIFLIEIIREFATLIIIFSVAYLTGKSFLERFSYFFIIFGIWDILYYVFLRIFIKWPLSLADWDILFLIPITWIGPVWSPLLVSIIFIVLGYYLINLKKKINLLHLLIPFFSGCLFVFFAFIHDYYKFLSTNAFFRMPTMKFGQNLAKNYIPGSFPLLPYIIGILLMLSPIILIRLTTKNLTKR